MDNLKRYREQWTFWAVVPCMTAVVVGFFCMVAGQWIAFAVLEIANHLLLLSPALAWTLGRRALVGVEPPPGVLGEGAVRTAYRSASVPAPTSEQAAAPAPRRRAAWAVSGPFPWWALGMGLLYLLIDIVGWLSFWSLFFASVALVAIARIVFYYFWISRCYRDAACAAVLEHRATDDGSRQLVLHRQDTMKRVTITEIHAYTPTVHLDVEGSPEVWTTIDPIDGLVRLHRDMASQKVKEDTCRV